MQESGIGKQQTICRNLVGGEGVKDNPPQNIPNCNTDYFRLKTLEKLYVQKGLSDLSFLTFYQ
jgi:hypothetical protein